MEETYTLVLGMQTVVSCRLELRIYGRGTNVLNYWKIIPQNHIYFLVFYIITLKYIVFINISVVRLLYIIKIAEFFKILIQNFSL